MGEKADLHIHTKASDGSYPSKKAVELANTNGLKAIGIVDHDTVEGISSAIEAGKGLGVKIVPGVELACSKNESDFEILGYFIDHENPKLKRKLQKLQEYRKIRARKMVNKLRKQNIDLSFDRVLKTSKEKSIGRPHIAWNLYKEGHVESIEEAFEKYLRTGKPTYVEKKRFSPKDAISLINQSGGVAVLAHPRYGGLEVLENLIEEGLEGIEVYHSMHKKDEEDKYHEIAQEYGLVEVGGSDSHGEYTPKIKIGNVRVDYKAVEKLEELSRFH